MIHKQILRKNRVETLIVCILNVSSLLILVLPIIAYGILSHSAERTSWIDEGLSSGAAELKSISLESGTVTYVKAEESFIESNILNGKINFSDDNYGCYIGFGEEADQYLKEIASQNLCNKVIDQELLPDAKSVFVINRAEGNVTDNPHEENSSIDYTAIYLLLVYAVIIGLPVFITYLNLTKLFDNKWLNINKQLYDRGFSNSSRAKITMAPTILGMALSIPVFIPFLYMMSKLSEKVSWEGRGFLPSDSLYGFNLGLISSLIITCLITLIVLIRRNRVIN